MEYGTWIPTHAVKFNEDGTVSMMTEDGRTGNRGRRRNIAAGFWDGPPSDPDSQFHPIRASYDYSRSRAGEGPKRKKAKVKGKKRRKR